MPVQVGETKEEMEMKDDYVLADDWENVAVILKMESKNALFDVLKKLSDPKPQMTERYQAGIYNPRNPPEWMDIPEWQNGRWVDLEV